MEYLIHYGIKRRSGRFPWGSGKRPFQSAKDYVAKRRTPEARTSRINKRASKKIEKIERRRVSNQEAANKYFSKAEKKSNALLSSQKSVNRELIKGANRQKEVNKLEYKGQKYYKRTLNKLDKIGKISDIDPEVKKLGEQYIESLKDNSKSLYNTLISGKTPIKYRK